jgi:hypothetical protein
MKILLPFLAIVSAAQTPVVSRVTRNADENDYYIGRGVGECLVTKCQIFRGFLTGVPTPEQGAMVAVSEQLAGPPIDGQIVRVPFAVPDQGPPIPGRVGSAWKGVTLARDTEVTVMLAVDDVVYTKAGNPIAVVSGGHRQAVIQHLAAEAARIEGSADGVSDGVDRLSVSPDPPVAGYLFTHAQRIETYRSPDLAGLLLAKMVGSSSVPPVAWNEICQLARTNYERMTADGRVVLIKRFVDLVDTLDPRVAIPAFNALEVTTHVDATLQTSLQPSEMAKLVSAYRALVGRGTLLKSQALEAAFGLQ